MKLELLHVYLGVSPTVWSTTYSQEMYMLSVTFQDGGVQLLATSLKCSHAPPKGITTPL